MNTRESPKTPHNQHSRQQLQTQEIWQSQEEEITEVLTGFGSHLSRNGPAHLTHRFIRWFGPFRSLNPAVNPALLCHLSHWSGLFSPKPSDNPCSAENGNYKRQQRTLEIFLWSATGIHNFLIHYGKLAGPQAARGKHTKFQIPVQMLLKLHLHKIYAGV